MPAVMSIMLSSKMPCLEDFTQFAIAVHVAAERYRHTNMEPQCWRSSGYVAVVDHDLCLDCGSCNDYCQFHALSIVEGVNTVNFELCMGCGICVSKCVVQAISLEIDPVKGIPLEINKLMEEVGYLPQN